VLLAAAILAAPALLQVAPPAGASSELFKTSRGETSAELSIQVPPGFNDSLAFTLPSDSLVGLARFCITGSPARLPAAVLDTGAGLLNASRTANLAFSNGSLALSEIPGASSFAGWAGSPACGTFAEDGRLRLARNTAAMQFGPNGRVFPSNQPEYDPALSVGPGDVLYLAWTDQSEYDFNIYLARSEDRGGSFSGPVKVNDNGTGKTRQESADVAAGPGSRVYVAWTDNRSGDEDIYLASSDDGGRTFSRNLRVDDGPAGSNASYPSMAVSPSGRVAVAWEDTRSQDKDVRCAFSADGSSFGPSVRMNTDSSGREQLRPRLSSGGAEVFHAVWYDNRSGDFDIYYARSSGSSFLAERRVDDTGDGGTFQALPAVAVGPDERVHVAWHDRRYDGYRIMYSGSADGIVFSANQPVSMVAGAGKDQFQPRLRVGPGGTVHVAWHDRRGGYPHIYYANSTSAGRTFGEAWRADDAPADTLCYSPVLGVDSLGGVHLAWWDNRTRQGAFGTNFQIFHSLGGNPYFGSGTFLSPVVDLGAAPSALDRASADSTTPPNTSISVRLATSPGDAGPWSDFLDLSAAGSPEGPPPARFVRWAVELSTREPSSTPSVAALRLGYRVHPSSGTLTSRPITLPHPVRTAAVYWTEGRTGEGPASLAIELSSNNGSTWQEARPGLPFEFGGAGRVLVYRVHFSGSSSSTPTLSSLSLELRMETYPSDVRVTIGRSAVTVWNLPGQLGGASLESPDMREDFNRQVQEARRASLRNATIRLNFTSATPGTITVRDIRIAYDLPPVILSRDPAGPASVEEGGSLAFSVSAADQDGDPLGSRWLLDGLPVDQGSLTFVFRPDFASSGVHNLTVVVSDGTLSASATWLVQVADVNRPPVIEAFSPADRQMLETGGAARFDVRASDPDGSPLSYSWRLDGGPAGASDRSFDYVAPPTPGVHTIRVDISDGQESVNRTWTVEVFRPAAPDNEERRFPYVQAAAGIMLAMALVLAVALLVRRPPGGARRARRAGRPPRRRGASVKLKNGNANQPQQ
jgi:hypothetical protein